MSVQYVGIDPGVTGAVCFIDSGEVEESVAIYDLPTTERRNGRARIHGYELLEMLAHELPMEGKAVIVVEAIHAMPVTGSIGVFSQGNVIGSIEAVLDIIQATKPDLTVKYVTPVVWKRYFELLKTTKEDSRALANRFFGYPDCLKRKKDHNRAEAALLALYAQDTDGDKDVDIANGISNG
jgi:crossover junction endodeoxyribonuclease RuvC